MGERKIVSIDKDKCDGCGICVQACHEGAIRLVDGKAELVSDIYCDGLGDCLKPCPAGAISLITRRADDYDAAAVAERRAEKRKSAKESQGKAHSLPCGCPGSLAQTLKPPGRQADEAGRKGRAGAASELMNWPVQLKLVPAGAEWLRGADILLAADCAAVAAPDFHAAYLKGRPVIIACPKLDDNEEQTSKLAAVASAAKPSRFTVLRMEVPCCGGLVRAAREAAAKAGLDIPVVPVILGVDGSEK
jgi:ferredoxin